MIGVIILAGLGADLVDAYLTPHVQPIADASKRMPAEDALSATRPANATFTGDFDQAHWLAAARPTGLHNAVGLNQPSTAAFSCTVPAPLEFIVSVDHR